MNRIGLYLDRSMFTHGQLYVALSRTRSASNIKILITNAHLSGDNTQFTDKIVQYILKYYKYCNLIKQNSFFAHICLYVCEKILLLIV